MVPTFMNKPLNVKILMISSALIVLLEYYDQLQYFDCFIRVLGL